MGVHGLWDLLAPVGHRVSVETLAGKRLAIDASIWMVQFMKAMRDEKGEMVRNAHLLGFFRRICKLLFLRTKPVFVFDGGTPTLKRRTVIARRRQRENAQAKVRKTAEKLFLNQIKAMRLSNLAENLKDQRNMGKSKGKEVVVDQSDILEKNNAGSGIRNQEILDEMLAASLVAEECGGFGSTESIRCTSTSVAAFETEDEDSDDDEMIMPIPDGNVDPAVLAALPPSMQLDLLVQMRERLMAENRQKYQKVKKAPQKFSELQIEAYLKTVAFRREIDEVQRAASGRGVGGVQTSRIASEANREFIFSSSFSGDKQVLASSGVENFSEKQEQLGNNESPSDIVDVIASSGSKADSEAGPETIEVETYLDEKGRKRIHRNRAMGIRMTRDLQRNIELMEESEHERTTANKKAIDQIEHDPEICTSENFACEGHSSPQKSVLESETSKDALNMERSIKINLNDDGKLTTVDDDDAFFTRLVAGSPLSICSTDNSGSDIEWEDGTSVKQSKSLGDGSKLETNSSHGEDVNKSESDVEWEERLIIADEKLEPNTLSMNNHNDNEIRVERQEADTKNLREVQQIKIDLPKAVSKGSVEEESALQEAIRRSLEDITGDTTSNLSFASGKSKHGSKKMGEALIGIELPKPFASENDQSNVLSVNNAFAPSTSVKYSKSATDECDDASRTFVTSPDDIKNLHFQQPKTCTEKAEIINLGSGESDVPTVTTFSALSSSLSVLRTDDITNREFTTGTFDMTVGHESPVMGLRTSHADIQRKADENDTIFVSVLERGHDVQIKDPHDDEDISNDLFGVRLEDELSVLGKEYNDLENEQKKHERNADSVNSEMFVECQELLQMFGLPYIIAPMEAEAQCAFLELTNLVDGVVTDDSDVFLFGARNVFKNIFDDRKYVETYLLKDIETELGLDTEKLIRMALLLGSDYTEGVSGIGIVNAIEVVNAFPEDDGLHKFREWVESPDPTILGKMGLQTGLSPKKTGFKGTSTSDCDTLKENEDDVSTDRRRRKHFFMNKHRNVSKNWHLPALFPSDAVISAYKSPQVDKSAEPFSWGKPDIFSLRRLCSEKFSWANQKADELLLPVLKEYNKHETQLRLEAFYSFNEKFANIRSKRIREAVKGITGKRSLANTDGLQELPKQVKKRGENTGNKSNTKKTDDIEEKKNSSKRSKSKKRETEGTKVVGTGCSQERGSSSGKAVKRGSGVQNSDSELDETSNYNLSGSSDEHELVLQPEKATLPCSVRRSKRTRKPTSYVERDDENDEPTQSPTRTNQKSTNDKVGQQKSFEFQDVHKIDMTEAKRQKQKTAGWAELCGANLVKGGGFCADEDNKGLTIDREGPIHSEGLTVDNDGEYLQMSGGFCRDDAEHLDFQDGAQELSNRPSLVSNAKPNKEHKSTDVNSSNLAKIVGNCDTPASVSAFSAIPFLKRKKRKI